MNEVMQSLFQAIQANPEDWDAYSVLADALEEKGRDDESFAWRWMAFHHKRPQERVVGPKGGKIDPKNKFSWWNESTRIARGGLVFAPYAILPRIVFELLPSQAIYLSDYAFRTSFQEAVDELTIALQRLRDVLRIT